MLFRSGDNWQAYVNQSFSSEAQYKASYPATFYWGNIAEVSITSETPWEDLKNKIFDSYGYVAGFDDPEIKQLILQSFFESWSPDEFLSHYKQTTYYNTRNKKQLDWANLSEAEKQYQINTTAKTLVDAWKNYYGTDIAGGLTNPDILAAAQAIASGTMEYGEWDYNTRKAAEAVSGTPAYRDRTKETQAQGKEGVDIENLTKAAEDSWRNWVGPVAIPNNFASKWANDIYMNTKSEADLQNYLETVSKSYWTNKPDNVAWADWAAPFKSEVQKILEDPNIADNDSLLSAILSGGLAGRDATLAIRKDSRFQKTHGFYSELSGTVAQVGRMFGFIT